MKNCSVVIYQSNTEGTDVCVFYDREEAIRDISEDVERVTEALRKEGYDPTVLEYDLRHTEVYVPNTDIYREWILIETDIK